MSSFGGTVKLTGESEYKKALADITSNLKMLNSEMKVVTSAYDKNDKSVENLSSQNEVLNKKIDEQKKRVNVLTEALEKSKAETGENSDTTKKWQVELNNAQADLNKLNREVEQNEKAMDEAASATKDNAKAVEDFGEEAEKSGEKALSLGDIIKANLISDAIKGGLQALANGIKAVGSAMSESLSAGAEYADNILTLSAQTGLSTDTLEKYNAVAELADVSMETFTGSLAKNVKAMSEAQKGSTKYVEAYDKLGVKVTDANGNLRDSEAVYWETVDALKGIKNETERDALAMELFGKKAQDLNTIVEMGSGGFKELEQTAVDMGAVLGGQGLEALGNYDDQMQIFTSTLGGTKNILASAFAPALTGAMTEVNEFGGAINSLISSVLSGDEHGIEGAMVRVSEEVGDVIVTIRDMVPQMMDVAASLISALVDSLIADLPWIVEQGVTLISSLLKGIVSYLPQIAPVVVQVVTTLIQGLADMLPTLIGAVLDTLTAVINALAESLPQIITTVVEMIPELINKILEALPLLIEAVLSLVMSIVKALPNIIQNIIRALPTIIQSIINSLLEALPMLIEAGIQLFMAIVEAIPVIIDALVEALPTIINTIIDGLLDALPMLLEGAIQLLMAIVQAIPTIISILVEDIPNIVTTIINALLERLPDLIKGAVQLFMGIVQAIPQIIKELVKQLPTIITTIVKSLGDGLGKIAEVGKNLVSGLWQGIKDAGAWIMDKIKGFGQSILDGIKGFFGIHSPSTLFKDEVGKNLALGVGEGFADTMTDVTDEMQNAIPTEFDAEIGTNLNMASGQTQMSTYDMMVSAFKQALTEVKVVMNDREMGGFVTNTVERVVFG